MFQGNLLAINLGISAATIFILFVSAVLFLVNTDDSPGKKYFPAAVLSISVAILILSSLVFHQFLVDDVYISLRYARNLANGYGLVFSTDGSEPVEGYTNFLWVLMEAPLFKMGISDESIVNVIRIAGIVFGAGVLLITYALMRILSFNKRISLIAVLFLAIIPEFSFWAVGGLETPMYMFWLLLGIYRYIYERKTGKSHIWSIVVFFLLALTRPEGLFITGAIICYHLLQIMFNRKKDPADARGSFMKILPGIVIFVVLYGGYFLWRFNTYGYLFPNTYYAKRIAYAGQYFHRVKEMSAFVGPMFPFIAVACIGFFQFNKKFLHEKLLLSLMFLVLMGFCFLARVEWMPGHRYELPFVPLIMIFFAAGLGKVLFSEIRKWDVPNYTRVIPFAVLFFFGAFMMSRFNDLRKTGNDFGKQLNRAHVPLGKWLKTHAPANASYASWDMGAVPFYSGLHSIIDINMEGLLNPYTTHNGYNIDRLLSLNPSFLVLPPNTSYVSPRDILDFYTNPKLHQNYDFLFTVAFDRDYILHVYKNKNVILTDVAVQEANNIADRSRQDLLH